MKVQCHRQGKVPFAVQPLVLMSVNMVHHTQPLQVQLKYKKVVKYRLIAKALDIFVYAH